MRLLGNIIWMLFGGIFTALYWFGIGCLLCITIVGIPLGRQAFKMASLTLAPFGKTIEYGGGAPSLIANVFWVVLAGIPMAFSYLVAGAVTASPSSASPLACKPSRWQSSRCCRLARQCDSAPGQLEHRIALAAALADCNAHPTSAAA